MPGRLFLDCPTDDVARWMSAKSAGISDPPRLNIAPGQEIIVCAPDRTLKKMRWGLIPTGRVNARGRPVLETIVNARSETVFEKSAFAGVERVLVPCSGWYEWTGKARRKTAWRIRRKSSEMIAFAAIADRWTAPGGQVVDQVATVTCEPNEDVRDIHHRMGVILEPDQFETWLSGTQEAAASMMRPLPGGLLCSEQALGVDWTQP